MKHRTLLDNFLKSIASIRALNMVRTDTRAIYSYFDCGPVCMTPSHRCYATIGHLLYGGGAQPVGVDKGP